MSQVERFRHSLASVNAEPPKGSKRFAKNYITMKKKTTNRPKSLTKLFKRGVPSISTMNKWAKTKKAQRWAGFSV